jgi:hypothetical protein
MRVRFTMGDLDPIELTIEQVPHAGDKVMFNRDLPEGWAEEAEVSSVRWLVPADDVVAEVAFKAPVTPRAINLNDYLT